MRMNYISRGVVAQGEVGGVPAVGHWGAGLGCRGRETENVWGFRSFFRDFADYRQFLFRKGLLAGIVRPLAVADLSWRLAGFCEWLVCIRTPLLVCRRVASTGQRQGPQGTTCRAASPLPR